MRADVPQPFTVGADVFDPKGGHIQGIAASEEALYIAQMTQLTKVDWTRSAAGARMERRFPCDAWAA